MSVDFAALRETMVDSQVRTQDVTDPSLIEAICATPRETLVPEGKPWLAYADVEIEYAPGRWMLRPRDAAKLLQSLAPKAGERALAVSAPYAAAVLKNMGLDVTRLDGPDLRAVSGNWDLIVCEGAVSETPGEWISALAVGGRLGVVVRNGLVGRATIYSRSEQSLGSRTVFDATPPVLAGFEPARSFTF